MRKIIGILLLVFTSCSFEAPTQFSEKALNDSLKTIENTSKSIKDILKEHKGKKLLINVWASWCGDCIVGMPKLKQLQKEFPDIGYVFISTDRNMHAWKRAMEKYNLKGDHYLLEKGMDSDFGDFLNSNWIPRYMVINENGFVDLFKATKVTDARIVKALKK
jgi:thiol-disulfide isomerase/thioredoxin